MDWPKEAQLPGPALLFLLLFVLNEWSIAWARVSSHLPLLSPCPPPFLSLRLLTFSFFFHSSFFPSLILPLFFVELLRFIAILTSREDESKKREEEKERELPF
ncbi:hypothetical protein BKA57DRAFT_446206 [Linnemannia elongata]|nr:hypothetical protein BKA57DRAFT_446206 [Linnemannia elongata]